MYGSLKRAALGAALTAALVLTPLLIPSQPAEAGITDLHAEERAALVQLNQIRVSHGLQPLVISPILTATAEWMAADLAARDALDHTDSLGRGLRARFSAFGYPANSYIRENLGAGYRTGADAMDAWMESPAHRANNLATDVSAVGIALVFADDTRYGYFWALTFGSHQDAGSVAVSINVSQPPAPSSLPPIGTTAGTFVSLFPAAGVGLNVWNGGSVQELVAAAAQGGARSLFVSSGGELIGYVVGAPAFVNQRFVQTFGELPANTAVLIVV